MKKRTSLVQVIITITAAIVLATATSGCASAGKDTSNTFATNTPAAGAATTNNKGGVYQNNGSVMSPEINEDGSEYENSMKPDDETADNKSPQGATMPYATSMPAKAQEGGMSPQYGLQNSGALPGEPSIQVSDGQNNEQYLEIVENQAVSTMEQSMFTFSLKVDTSSYSNIERYINNGSKPVADAVKIEELINYFNYDNEMQFENDSKFAIETEIGRSPFDAGKYLAYVRVKAKDIDRSLLPNSNLTFLIDTSGSMDSFDKLPLLKTAFSMLVETLTKYDTVSIVTYAGSSEIMLDSVPGDRKKEILDAINNLSAGGSTAGADGINTAYKLTEKNFIKDGNNRVILATDGDFNVGLSSVNELEKLISEKKNSGVYLSILGFGTGNIRDDIMETLSKSGNGNYSYINSVSTAQKVLVDELSTNLYTIANDVKAQIECNPQNIKSYRLIGYENRKLENQDFSDDTKDAGEIGIGTDVVIMFEFELNNGENSDTGLKYQTEKSETETSDTEYSDELFEIRIRYKEPGQSDSKLLLHPAKISQITENNSQDFRFASAVAAFGHILRNSSYSRNISLDNLIETAENNLGYDTHGYRYQFIGLMRDYRNIR